MTFDTGGEYEHRSSTVSRMAHRRCEFKERWTMMRAKTGISAYTFAN